MFGRKYTKLTRWRKNTSANVDTKLTQSSVLTETKAKSTIIVMLIKYVNIALKNTVIRQ